MRILAGRKGKTADELTRIEEQDKNKAHMLVRKITGSTPGEGEIHQKNLIPDLTEEKYLELTACAVIV